MKHYEVRCANSMDDMEYMSILDDSGMYGIVGLTRIDANHITFFFIEEEEVKPIAKRLGAIANWLSLTGVDEDIVHIREVTTYETNYVHPQIHHLMSHDSAGSC